MVDGQRRVWRWDRRRYQATDRLVAHRVTAYRVHISAGYAGHRGTRGLPQPRHVHHRWPDRWSNRKASRSARAYYQHRHGHDGLVQRRARHPFPQPCVCRVWRQYRRRHDQWHRQHGRRAERSSNGHGGQHRGLGTRRHGQRAGLIKQWCQPCYSAREGYRCRFRARHPRRRQSRHGKRRQSSQRRDRYGTRLAGYPLPQPRVCHHWWLCLARHG